MKKQILRILFILVIFCVSSCTSFAKDIFLSKLPTGHTVIIKEVKGNPIVTIDTWVKTGSVNEDDTNSGIAHFLEHLFFKGTQKYPTGEFEKLLEAKGAITNAATSKEYTHYYITLPSKDFNLALELHSDMLLNPQIPRKELEKERHVVLEEIARGMDEPNNILINNLFKVLYEDSNHPYKRPVIGNSEVIKSVTREEILNYYNDFYSPANMVTVIVGDINEDTALEAIKKYFGEDNSKNRKNKKIKYPKIQPLNKIKEIKQEKNIKNIYMTLVFKIPKFENKKECYALDVLSTILGEGKSSKLNRSLREEKQIVNSISSSSSSLMQDGLFLISANYETKYSDLVLNEIFKQINSIKQGDITESEISKAKNLIETSTYFERESITNISNELGYTMLYWGNLDYYDNYIENIKKVTKKDVIKVAKKYLKEDKYLISKVVPNGYKVSEGKKVRILKDYEAEMVQQSKNKTKYLLDNGSTLILEKNPNNSIIAINISNIGGSHREKIPTILSFAASMVKEGTKQMTGAEIANFLDENAIGLSFNSKPDNFSINIKTTKNELKNAFYILDELVNNATFTNISLEKIKKQKLSSLKNLEDNSVAYAIDKFKGYAFKNTIYSYNSDTLKKYINQIKEDDVRNAFYEALEPQNLTVSIVGDVDDKYIINEISSIFNKENYKKYKMSDFKEKNYLPSKNEEYIIEKDGLETSWILLGYKTTDIYNEKDKVTLDIINAIMGDGMSSRLFRTLRESKGLAYQVGSVNYQYMLDGTFLTYIGTNPKNIQEAKRGILSEINTIRTEFVSKNELQEAKDKILGNLLIEMETNMDNANINASNSILGRDLEYIEKYKNLINSITQNDIINVANKYFSKPYIMLILK